MVPKLLFLSGVVLIEKLRMVPNPERQGGRAQMRTSSVADASRKSLPKTMAANPRTAGVDQRKHRLCWYYRMPDARPAKAASHRDGRAFR